MKHDNLCVIKCQQCTGFTPGQLEYLLSTPGKIQMHLGEYYSQNRKSGRTIPDRLHYELAIFHDCIYDDKLIVV